MVDGVTEVWDIKQIPPIHFYTRGINSSTIFDPSQSEAWLTPTYNVIRGVFLVIVCLLGAAFNIFIIVAIVPNRRLRTVRNILLVHLGCVGLLSSMFTTSYPTAISFYGRWQGGPAVCLAHTFLTCLLTTVSVWTIAALSWDKYQIIVSPLHHSLTATRKKMLHCFLIVWTCGLILAFPSVFEESDIRHHSPMVTCGVTTLTSSGRWYKSLFICFCFVFPFCIIIYCYFHIFRIARTQSSRIAATMLRMIRLIEAPIASTTHKSPSLRGTKAIGTILHLIGSFVLTYLPYALLILYEVIFSVHANDFLISIATTLFLSAPFTQASIYGVRNQVLRSSFHRYVRRTYQYYCVKDKRRGSVRSLTRKSSKTMRIPMNNLTFNDDQHYIFQGTTSCHAKPVDIQVEDILDMNTSKHEPCDLFGEVDGWPQLECEDENFNMGEKSSLGVNQINELSYLVSVDEVLFVQPQKAVVQPDFVSHEARHENLFNSKNELKEVNLIDWGISEDPSIFEDSNSCKQKDDFDNYSSSDTLDESSSKLYPIKEIIANFEIRRSKERTSLLKGKHKTGRLKKRSSHPKNRIDTDDLSMNGVCHLEKKSTVLRKVSI